MDGWMVRPGFAHPTAPLPFQPFFLVMGWVGSRAILLLERSYCLGMRLYTYALRRVIYVLLSRDATAASEDDQAELADYSKTYYIHFHTFSVFGGF